MAYATELKAQVLAVDAELLATGGAVQAEVARQMATGVCRVLGADVGVATTGVAGPDPQDGHPVGTVFVAVAAGGQRGGARARPAGDRATVPGPDRRRSRCCDLLAGSLVAGEVGGTEDSRPTDS